MKIRSAAPENGCLIFMHYRMANEKKTESRKQKAKGKKTHSRPLEARMRKRWIPDPDEAVMYRRSSYTWG